MKGSKLIDQTGMILILCLTLGLAPFYPEPHIWGKLKWLAGGAVGMKAMDWFDLFLHGAPWILFLISITRRFLQKS